MKIFLKDFPNFPNFFNFQQFNEVQKKCYKPLTQDKRNMVVSAPTSSGKTVIFQLAILNQYRHSKEIKCLYIAPIKSLCHQKSNSWQAKFGSKLRIFELTSDTSNEQQNNTELLQMNLVIATPQKIDAFSRKSLHFLSKINLLLVDEVHMLNVEERGATLQAVLSRIMSINNPRIIAVSATIPNIKQVAQWLKVQKDMSFVFGEQYRPVKIQKVVLGFKSTNNPYTFQKMLNYKVVEVIRNYSQQKGVLIFCQTQKGTQMACQQIITDMRERQFIDSDQVLMSLIQVSKKVSNSNLQSILPQGIAFHNAGLSMSDRTIVQKLFLQNKLKILCTTSTLAMGINLPARLVIIKSTQCYRGAGKGYQEYTQIQIDQMMGRAGRPPFDKEGTVVIMTQKQNYNRYVNIGKLQTLQSHLYQKLCEHLNAQISLKSIKSLENVLTYFMNSFCYIRMKNSPVSYGIKGHIKEYVQKICLQSISKLDRYALIKYYQQNSKIIPRKLGVSIARNSVEIQTIVNIIKQLSKVKSQKDYLSLICQSEEINKYRNKLDERKLLKQINQKNKYVLKSAIANSEKKCYVLIQCELDGIYIENWQMRKQSKDMIYFLRRLTFCLKTACADKKLFWPYYWSCQFNKYFTLKFWQRNQQMLIRQFPQLNQKWKLLTARGIKNIIQLLNNIEYIDTICQKNSHFSHMIEKKIMNLKQSIVIYLQNISTNNNSNNIKNNIEEKFEKYNQQTQIFQQQPQQNENQINITKCAKTQKDKLIVIKFSGFFDDQFRSVQIIIGHNNDLYTIRTLKSDCKQTRVAIDSSRNYNIAVIKANFIGFDEFYQYQSAFNRIKPIENMNNLNQNEKQELFNKKVKDKMKSFNILNKQQIKNGQESNKIKSSSNLQLSYIKQENSNKKGQKIQKKRAKSSQWVLIKDSTNNSQNISQNKKISKPSNNKRRINQNSFSRKKPLLCQDDSNQGSNYLHAQAGTYIPLNQYKCWRPGFRKFEDPELENKNRETMFKNLKIGDETSSKQRLSKQKILFQNLPTIKTKPEIKCQNYAYNSKKEDNLKQNKSNGLLRNKNNIQSQNQLFHSSPYDYFMNLFDN